MWPFRRRKRHLERAAPTFGPMMHPVGNPWGSLATEQATISPCTAENLAAVLAAVNAISCTIASLPAYVVKAGDSRADVPDHPLAKLIEFGVNDDETWSDFCEGLLASCLLRGNALAEVETDTRGRLTGLRTLPWRNITPHISDDGTLLFDYTPTVPPRAAKRRRYMKSDVLHLKDRSDDGLLGVSRLHRAANALQVALELQTSASTFLHNAARPSGALTTPQRITEETVTRWKQEFDQAYSGGERGRVAVLQGGVEFKPLSLVTSEDAEVVSHRNFSVADVSRIYGVPPFMLADPSRSTFASAREGSRHFAMMCLAPWVRKIERAFAQSVLSSSYRLVIDLNDLLRADPEARWASWQRARQAGVLSPNEIRSEENWPASTDPTADSIEPPVAGMPASGAGGETGASSAPPVPTPADDDAADDESKVARLDQHRQR